jgi:hypothetical protein
MTQDREGPYTSRTLINSANDEYVATHANESSLSSSRLHVSVSLDLLENLRLLGDGLTIIPDTEIPLFGLEVYV